MKNRWIYVWCCFLLCCSPLHGQISTNAEITSEPETQFETSIAVSPLSPASNPGMIQVIGWEDFDGTYFQPAYAFTTNGGANWIRGVVPDASEEYVYGQEPSVAFDRYGNAFYCYVATRTSNPRNDGARVVVARTANYGSNWSWTFITEDIRDDSPSLAVDNSGILGKDGRVYISWTSFALVEGRSQIRVAVSTNHGSNFTVGPVLAEGVDNDPPPFAYSIAPGGGGGQPEARNFVQGSEVAISSAAEVIVMWNRADEGFTGTQTQIEMRKAVNGDLDFGSVLTSPNLIYSRVGSDIWVGSQALHSIFHTSIATNPVSPNKIYLTFSVWNSGDVYAYLSRSTDGGVTWSAPQSPYNIYLGWEYFQHLAVDSTERISIALYHSVYAPPPTPNVELYVASCEDANLVFPFPSVSRAYPAQFVPDGALTYFYLGHTSVGGFGYSAWTNHIAGNADIYWTKVDFPPVTPKNLTVVTISGQYGYHYPYLSWTRAPESDVTNGGYALIERRIRHSGVWSAWSQISQQSGSVTNFTDYTISTAGYGSDLAQYRIRTQDAAGQHSPYSAVVSIPISSDMFKVGNSENSGLLPKAFALWQNYPNPFNPTTVLSYDLPEDAFVSLAIFDILGREVATLVSGMQKAGSYRRTFDAVKLSSGIYVCRLYAGQNSALKKLVVSK